MEVIGCSEEVDEEGNGTNDGAKAEAPVPPNVVLDVDEDGGAGDGGEVKGNKAPIEESGTVRISRELVGTHGHTVIASSGNASGEKGYGGEEDGELGDHWGLARGGWTARWWVQRGENSR